MNFNNFADFFQYTKLELIVTGHRFGDCLPYSFCGAIRGTWGKILKELEDKNISTSPLLRASANHIFFESPKLLTKKYGAFAAPYVFSATPIDKHKTKITLTLFGMATDWYNDAYIAMDKALSCETIKVQHKSFYLKILDYKITPYRFTPKKMGNIQGISFISPLILKRQNIISTDLKRVFLSIASRLKHIAHYHSLKIDDLGDDILDEIKQTTLTDNLQLKTWVRYSKRNPGREYLMVGFLGEIFFDSPLSKELLLLLQYGEIIHAGSYTNFGLGEFKLIQDTSSQWKT